jgi:hypothetical protein
MKIKTIITSINFPIRHDDSVNEVTSQVNVLKIESFVTNDISQGDSKYKHDGRLITIIHYEDKT